MATHGYIINKQDNNIFYGTAKKQRRRDKEPISKITSGTRAKTE
jgi:hypothetical protein